jgi:hypothetical protein
MRDEHGKGIQIQNPGIKHWDTRQDMNRTKTEREKDAEPLVLADLRGLDLGDAPGHAVVFVST